MDDIIAKLGEKLDPAVQRLRDGKDDPHDIFPGLLWVLLQYRDDLKQLRDRAERTSAEINGLAKTLQEESEKLRHDTSEDLIKTGDDLKTRIGNLAQTFQAECEKLRHHVENVGDSIAALLKSSNEDLRQTLRQSALQLQKVVETKADDLSGATQSALRRTDNKLRWILIGTVFQIIFILTVLFLLFNK